MFYHSPTYGKVTMAQLQSIVSKYINQDKSAKYKIIVGSDSQKVKNDAYDFVTALVIHRIGMGGIYFWKREIVDKKMSLKQRIYDEATRSLIASENFLTLLKHTGISRYDIQIHVDIGTRGPTNQLINEVTGMIRGSGYDIRIKPDSFGASKVADKYT